MKDIRLDNYCLYLHLDKSDVSVMGRPEDQPAIVDYVPTLVQSIAVGLPDGRVERGPMNNSEYGWQQKLIVEYSTGRITLRYNKIFRNSPATEEEQFKKYIVIGITIENYLKLDYSYHHYVCRLVDAILDQHWTTRDHHIRRAELAGDTLDPVVGPELLRTMVPFNACIEGWECKKKSPEHPNGLKRKAWLAGAEGQYYWGSKTEVDKDRETRRREWNPHIHRYGSVPIWRIELRLGRKYLSDIKINTHAQLLGRMVELYTHNVRFQRPRSEAIRNFLLKCRQKRKYPRFIAKSWESYQKLDQYSTCAWMDDLQKRIGGSVSRFFYDVDDYPDVYTCEQLSGYYDKECNMIYVSNVTC